MPASRRPIFLAGLLLALAGLAVYSNSFSAPFIFDDLGAIVENPTIQHGWREALNPPNEGRTVMGRPLINLSLALNYQLGGFDVRGYHAVNLLIHLLAGLTLFGLVRRTLEQPLLQTPFGECSLPLAFSIALLWIVHPLQTESVTYTIQRAEALMGLFYLLTLYFFVRGVESPRPWLWHGPAFVACLLGMLSKEVMASAPLIVLLYDRTFVAGTFRDAWRRRRLAYLALFSTWIPLFWVAFHTSLPMEATMLGKHAGEQTLSTPGLIWWTYLLKQCEAVVLYLRLSFWPHPLVLDYGADLTTNAFTLAPRALALGLLFAGSIWALVRRPALGFLGACFFLILAPSSSVVPLLSQTMAEHRMYLSLAAVLTLAMLGWWRVGRQHSLPVALALAVALGCLTYQRNRDYTSNIGMKRDLVAKAPDYAPAHYYLGDLLAKAGRAPEAIRECEEVIRLKPNNSNVEAIVGFIMQTLKRPEQAIPHFEKAIEINPGSVVAHCSLGIIFFEMRRFVEAARELTLASLLSPDHAEIQFDLADALLALGHTNEALGRYDTGLRLTPDWVPGRKKISQVLLRNGQPTAALPHAREAVRLAPNDPETHLILGNALVQLHQPAPAEVEFRAALRLRPDYPAALNDLGSLFAQLGHFGDVLPAYAQAVQHSPNNLELKFNYANALFDAGQFADAVNQYQQLVRFQPDSPQLHNNLGNALLRLGQLSEARAQYQEALRLKPDYADAQRNLAGFRLTPAAPP